MTKPLDEQGRPLTYDHLKSRKKPVTRRVPIVLDSELAEELNEWRSKADLLERRIAIRPEDKDLPVRLAEAEEQIEELVEANLDNIVEFVFRSIGRPAFEDLISNHPPTKRQEAEAKRKGEDTPTWNEDTFPQAVVHACLQEPKFELEDVADIFASEDWNHAELMALLVGALEVNQERRIVDLKKGSGSTRS